MTLHEILGMLKKGKLWLIIIPLVAVLISATLSIYVLEPVYQASATLILTKTDTEMQKELDYYTFLLNKQLIKTYQQLAKSHSILQIVVDSVNDRSISLDKLSSMVKVELVGETGLICIKVENTDPQKAALLANTLSNVLVEQIPRFLKIDNVKIVDKANVPPKPYKPNIKVNIAVAGLIGLALGFGIIFLMAYFDNTLHSGQEAEKFLHLPNLGVIPKLAKGSKLVAFDHPRSIAAETYRTLRTNITFSSLEEELEVLLVTSASAQEGKSTTAANLAVAFAQTGNQVILIDADLRLPTQHDIFEISQMPGITNVLLKETLLQDSLKATRVPGLKVLTTGPLPPNPAELLGSNNMKAMIDEARKMADIVIVDTAPVGPVIDAAVLANLVDGVLLVIKSGKSKREIIQMAKEQLLKANAKIYGTVLNSLKVNENNGYYSYYYGEKKMQNR